MYYVYILRSLNHPEQIYVGRTQNLKKRLSNHNAGTTFHTAKYRPWEYIAHFAFKEEITAQKFEEYLKSHSGRAFRDKRLI